MLPTEYNDDLVQDFEIETQPTRTYALRFDGYPCSGGKLDGLEAMKQAIFLILQTERFQYAIYSWNYGIELNALLGQTMTPYLQAKVAKAIEDALMADDRVLSVEQFSFTKGKRSLLVKFTVTTTEGDVESSHCSRMRKRTQEESCKVLFRCEQQNHQKHGTEHRKSDALQPGQFDVRFRWFGLCIPSTVMQGNGILRLQRHKNAEPDAEKGG